MVVDRYSSRDLFFCFSLPLQNGLSAISSLSSSRIPLIFTSDIRGVLGVLWLSIGVLFIPALGIIASYSPTGDLTEGVMSEGFNTAFGVYLIGWSLATLVLLICSIKTNIAFVITFAVLDVGLFISAASHLKMASDPTTGIILQKVLSFGGFD
jgi:uncharacterized protein